MGQNYNLNSTFGYNVTQRTAQKQPEAQRTNSIDTTISSLIDSFSSFSPEKERVYSGDVAKEINMYTRQAKIVGMNLRNAEDKRRFDVNM